MRAFVTGGGGFIGRHLVRGLVASGGDVRAIAVTSAERARAFPDVPTVAEQGFPGFEAMNWTGLVAPAGLPEPVLARWSGELRRTLSGPEIATRLSAEGSEPVGSTPAEFRAKLATEITKWGQIVREGQFRLD